MKKNQRLQVLTGIALVFIFSHFLNAENNPKVVPAVYTEGNLKSAAFKILETKCNTCHKRQNPFMVFKEKNMEKRAQKINEMVFIERKMPKGNDVKLSPQEYTTLKNWLASLSIY